MKRKIFSVLFTLVLVLSVSMIMATPVAADIPTAVAAANTALLASASAKLAHTNAGGLTANTEYIAVVTDETTLTAALTASPQVEGTITTATTTLNTDVTALTAFTTSLTAATTAQTAAAAAKTAHTTAGGLTANTEYIAVTTANTALAAAIAASPQVKTTIDTDTTTLTTAVATLTAFTTSLTAATTAQTAAAAAKTAHTTAGGLTANTEYIAVTTANTALAAAIAASPQIKATIDTDTTTLTAAVATLTAFTTSISNATTAQTAAAAAKTAHTTAGGLTANTEYIAVTTANTALATAIAASPQVKTTIDTDTTALNTAVTTLTTFTTSLTAANTALTASATAKTAFTTAGGLTSNTTYVAVVTAETNLHNALTVSPQVKWTIETATTNLNTAVTALGAGTYSVPTVTHVYPTAGNIGDTMWAEVTGTNFTGTTAACTTTFAFSSGVSVVPGSYHWISATEIDCKITITAAGTPTVTPTSSAGLGTAASSLFTANAANTKQVDVWAKYTPSDTTFTTNTLQWSATDTTITAAIGHASDTYILIAHAATYSTGETFPIVINNAITLKSMSGAASTNITNATDLVLKITHANVTVGGIGSGFRILGKNGSLAYGASGIHLSNATGITIQGNTFRSVATGQGVAIALEGQAQSGTLIDSNIFYGDHVYTPADDTVEGGAGTAILVGGGTAGGSTLALTVSNNLAYNLKYTLLTFVDNALNGDVVVTGNEAHDNIYYGIQIGGGGGVSAIHSLHIYQNKFYNNGAGIDIRSGTGNIANILINYNDIYNNTRAGWDLNHTKENQGIYNAISTSVNATHNWWGDASGPTVTGNDRGAGDALSTYVTYEPWLTTNQAIVISSGIRYFGYNWFSSSLSLKQGWNIWSTPIALDPQCDTWGEYRTLGTDLALATGANAYYFNGTTQSWVSVTDSYALTPCDAIYINMASTQTSPILFSPATSAPSKALVAGWNLVSASYVDNILSPVITNGVAAETALASIYYVSGANNVGYSQVVSPAVNQPAWNGVRGPAINTPVGDDMLPCKGYWIYMTNPGTLAGTVFTPVLPLTDPT